LPFGAVTRMVGSCVPSPAGVSSEAGGAPGCPSPALEGEGSGAVVASAGGGGDCGIGDDGVCASALAQTDASTNHANANRRTAPPPKATAIHPGEAL